MTPFQQVFASIRREILTQRHARRFEEARDRHLVLAAHGSRAAVLGALELQDRHAYAEKEALARVLISEQQASPSTLWASMLLVTCYPMLGNLRARIAGTDLSLEELDQLVLAAFLDAVAEHPVHHLTDRTFFCLRVQTQRRVFRWLADEQQQQDLLWPGDPPELDELGDPRWPECPQEPVVEPPDPTDLVPVVSLLVERAGDILDGQGFDLVTATLICGRGIRSFVQRSSPGLDDEEERRLYQNAKRKHGRAVARLRKKMAGGCPRSEDLMLYPV